MGRPRLLLLDAVINFFLGILLLVFPESVVDLLGVPHADVTFYPGILGGVLLGIAVALWIEHRRKSEQPAGLGLAGAAAINLCGAAVVVGWLLFGGLDLPGRGQVFLWTLAIVLIAISVAEMVDMRRSPPDQEGQHP